MKTPIERVRAEVRYWQDIIEAGHSKDNDLVRIAALATVLEMAERYEALKLAYLRHGHECGIQVHFWDPFTSRWTLQVGSIDEFADKLKEAT